MVRANRIVALVIVALGLGLLYDSQQYKLMSEFGPGPGFWPTWLALAWIILGALWFLQASKGENKQLFESSRAACRVPIIVVVFLGYLLLFDRLGLILSTALFLMAVLWLYERRSFVSSAITAVAVPVGLHLLFVTFLNVALPGGPLMP